MPESEKPEKQHPEIKTLLLERIKTMRVGTNLGGVIEGVSQEMGQLRAFDKDPSVEEFPRMIIVCAMVAQKALYENQARLKSEEAQAFAQQLDALLTLADEALS